MDDAQRLLLIRSLATNAAVNVVNGADEDNAPLINLIHQLAFEMTLKVEDPRKQASCL